MAGGCDGAYAGGGCIGGMGCTGGIPIPAGG